MPPPLHLRAWSSVREDGAPTDLIIECGGHTFHAHQDAVCLQSQRLQEACSMSTKVRELSICITHITEADTDSLAQQGLTVRVQESTFDAITMKRMLDFMYCGDYDVYTMQERSSGGDHNAPTKLDVLSHLFCFAIGESYLVKNLGEYALANFDESLRVVTPKDFAELVGAIALHTEAMPVHCCLRNVALDRLDELAECETFVEVLGGEHLTATLEQQHGESGEKLYRNLQAAIRLATLGADLFRAANQTKSRAALENVRLSRVFKEASEAVELFRMEAASGSAMIQKSEKSHARAIETLLAAEKEAQQAKNELSRVSGHSFLMSQDLESTKSELAKAEEQAASAVQALEKAELELEILQNEDRNNRQALEKHNRLPATAERSLRQREQQLATSQRKLDASQSTMLGQQRAASRMEQSAIKEKKAAVEERETYEKLQSHLQDELQHEKRLATVANQMAERAFADNKVLREQTENNSVSMPNQAFSEHLRFQEKTFHAQQINALQHHRQQMDALQAELNRANLQNSTMQKTIDDLRILTARGGRQS